MSSKLEKIFRAFIVCAFFANFILFGIYPSAQNTKSFLDPNKNLAVLLVFNGKHDQEAENLLASIKKNAPDLVPYITVCVSDFNSKHFAVKHHLQYFQMSNIVKSGKYMTRAMRIMNRRKLEAIEFLLGQGKDVLYSDTDVVFLANPLKEINVVYDLNIQNDRCHPPYDNSLLCTGFMYIASNSQTISFFQSAVNEMIEKQDVKDFGDQEAVNLLLKRGVYISVNSLDACKFPNGCRYFDNSDPNCKRSDALIIHNNFIIGLKKKHKRFKENNLLFTEHGT